MQNMLVKEQAQNTPPNRGVTFLILLNVVHMATVYCNPVAFATNFR